MDFTWLYSFIINNHVNIIFELISTGLVLITLLNTHKYWWISSFIIGAIALFFVDNTTIWSLFVFNIAFTAITYSFKWMLKFYSRIDNLRYNAKKNNLSLAIRYNILLKFLWGVSFIIIVLILFFGVKNIFNWDLSWYILFLYLFPILSMIIYFSINFISEFKKLIFLNFFLKNNIEDFREDIKKLWLYWYIENITDKQIEELSNLRILDFIINFLRREIKESDVVYSIYANENKSSYEDKIEIHQIIDNMTNFIEKMNNEFSLNYLSQIAKSIKQQNMPDDYKAEIIYILYIVHIAWRYYKLKDHYVNNWIKDEKIKEKNIKTKIINKRSNIKKTNKWKNIFEESTEIF